MRMLKKPGPERILEDLGAEGCSNPYQVSPKHRSRCAMLDCCFCDAIT